MLLSGSGDELCGLLPALFQTVAYYWPAVIPYAFLALFTESLSGDHLLVPPLFSSALSATLPLGCVLVFRSLFIVHFFFFCRGISLPRGLCWFIPEVAREIHVMLRCSPVWYAKCHPSRFGAGLWQWQQLSCFLSVTWCGEAFYRLVVQGVEVLILLGVLFLPSVAPTSQQGFGVTELTLSASVP
jgi:hypothetical protein